MAHHAWPRAGSNPPLQGAGSGAATKPQQDQDFAPVRVVVSRVLRIYASFDVQFHRSINRQTYDVIGRFRLTIGQKAYLAAVARMPCIDGGSDRRKTKITALTRPESGHDLFQPCRRHHLPRAQYVACRRVPRGHKSGGHSGQFRTGRQLRQNQSDLPCDLALGHAFGRGVSRCLNAPRGAT